MDFSESNKLRSAFHARIPGGGHTYAKGDDQYPEHCAPYLVRGEGRRVWDVDGNEFIEYGMGLRAVTLGHARPEYQCGRAKQMALGANFTRPAVLELECAEEFASLIPSAEMVKFAKNGSDVTTAAVKLARAYTGRDMIAVCADHPFFSTDDWFIGSTPMSAGIPDSIRDAHGEVRLQRRRELCARCSPRTPAGSPASCSSPRHRSSPRRDSWPSCAGSATRTAPC